MPIFPRDAVEKDWDRQMREIGERSQLLLSLR